MLVTEGTHHSEPNYVQLENPPVWWYIDGEKRLSLCACVRQHLLFLRMWTPKQPVRRPPKGMWQKAQRLHGERRRRTAIMIKRLRHTHSCEHLRPLTPHSRAWKRRLAVFSPHPLLQKAAALLWHHLDLLWCNKISQQSGEQRRIRSSVENVKKAPEFKRFNMCSSDGNDFSSSLFLEGGGVKKLMCNTSLLSDICIKLMNEYIGLTPWKQKGRKSLIVSICAWTCMCFRLFYRVSVELQLPKDPGMFMGLFWSACAYTFTHLHPLLYPNLPTPANRRKPRTQIRLSGDNRMLSKAVFSIH